jgi:hypothetical protein
MTARDLAFVGCRLLALYLGITAAYQAISIAVAWERIVESSGVPREELSLFSMYVLPLTTHIVVAAFLWIGARYFSRLVAALPKSEALSGSFTPAAFQAVALFAVGLFLLASAVPELLVVLHRYATVDEHAGQFGAMYGTGERLATATLRAIVGGFLIAYPQFGRLRKWLQQDAFD